MRLRPATGLPGYRDRDPLNIAPGCVFRERNWTVSVWSEQCESWNKFGWNESQPKKKKKEILLEGITAGSDTM